MYKNTFPLLLGLLIGCDVEVKSSYDTGDTGTAETDEFGGQEGEEFGTTDTGAVGTDVALVSSATSLVFNVDYVGCINEDTLMLTNTGTTDITITGAEFSKQTTEFRLAEGAGFPALLSPEDELMLTVQYAPLDEQEDLIELQLFTDADTDAPTLTITSTGSGLLYDTGSEKFSTDGISSRFAISPAAVSETLAVNLDGALLSEEEWSFSESETAVVLSTTPLEGALLEVSYAVRAPECKQ